MSIRLLSARLAKVMPRGAAAGAVERFAPHLAKVFDEFDISNGRRQAAFVAQIAHESLEMTVLRELASGDAYENRKDLGNIKPGDGRKFKGGGLIQTTGRENFRRVSIALGLGMELVLRPEGIVEPEIAARSAGFFWADAGLNALADQNHFGAITKRINGGFNGLDQRCAFWAIALAVFSEEGEEK